MGHYVCWNCSNDIRMPEQSESEIVEEYRSMLSRQELSLERRNRVFFFWLVGILVVLAAVNLVLGWHPGTSVLLLGLAVVPVWWSVKATRRIGRLRAAQEG